MVMVMRLIGLEKKAPQSRNIVEDSREVPMQDA